MHAIVMVHKMQRLALAAGPGTNLIPPPGSTKPPVSLISSNEQAGKEGDNAAGD